MKSIADTTQGTEIVDCIRERSKFFTGSTEDQICSANSDPKDGEVWVREWFDYASTRVPNMQIEKMKEARGVGVNLSFVEGEERVPDLERRVTQTPRVFYRRESGERPLIVAKR